MEAVLKLDQVARVVGDLPHMRTEQAVRMTQHIMQHEPSSVLELGFRHGVSTCFIAAALDEVGGDRRITTVDLEGARTNEPNVEQLLEDLGLRHMVTVYYEPTSYTWRLMRMLEADVSPTFDLCYLDGAHNWFVDGFAFLLVAKLLGEDAWIILDDLDWSYATSPTLADSTEAMPADERDAKQVRMVWELLVKRHPSFGDFLEEGDWGFARKLTGREDPALRVEFIREQVGLGAAVEDLIRRGRRRFQSRRSSM